MYVYLEQPSLVECEANREAEIAQYQDQGSRCCLGHTETGALAGNVDASGRRWAVRNGRSFVVGAGILVRVGCLNAFVLDGVGHFTKERAWRLERESGRIESTLRSTVQEILDGT